MRGFRFDEKALDSVTELAWGLSALCVGTGSGADAGAPFHS